MRLELGELKSINSQAVECEEQLKSALQKVQVELESISRNIDSSLLKSANLNFGGRLAHASSSITTAFANVIQFFASQLEAYNVNLEDVHQKITNLINIIDGCIDANGSIVKSFKEANISYTPATEYDMSNLHKFLDYYEGSGEIAANGDYVIYVDSDGSLTAGPGMHISNVVGDTSGYYAGGTISKDLIDKAVEQGLVNIRANIENVLATEEFSNLSLTDSQLDSLTSLLYNTGNIEERTPYFLNKYKQALENNTTLYEWTTKYWVNAGEQFMPGLARRRAGENVLFEQGYDAWIEWLKNNP